MATGVPQCQPARMAHAHGEGAMTFALGGGLPGAFRAHARSAPRARMTRSAREVSQSVRAVSTSSSAEPISTNGGVASSSAAAESVARAKARLLRVVENVRRGAETDAEQRGIIEEAQVDLEAQGGGGAQLMEDGALDVLHGLWRLKYSSASDVLSILRLPDLTPLPFPLLQVGDIYQNFVCRGASDSGVIQNIVDWSIPGLLEEGKGARFAVTADFQVCSSTCLLLSFREAAVDSVRISEGLQAVLAPAVLPRTPFSLEALQFLRSFDFRVPFQSRGTDGASRQPGGRYLLTFLDEDVLVGRSNAPSGSFIFERVKE